MAGKQIKRGVNIYIDDKDAQLAAKALSEQLNKIILKLKELNSAGEQNGREWNTLKTKLRETAENLRATAKSIDINKMSMAELESTLRRLKGQLRYATPNSEEWQTYANATQKATIRLRELQAGAKNVDGVIQKLDMTQKQHYSTLERLAHVANKFQAMVSGFMLLFGSMIFGVQRAVRAYTELTDAMADARKTTGLTMEEVKSLDKTLQNYDTRTSRAQLLELAKTAGKLGIEGKRDIEGFVRSADKIKVALGEDLGEDATKNLGKIANVFGLIKNMGYEEALSRIGSAVNDLGQSSTASEQYLVDWTQRIAGVGKQAGISVQNMLGYASALDQAGQNVEISATAVQRFLIEMLSNTSKYAKIAGLDVQKFNTLVGKDANEAMLQLLQAMHQRGGLQQLIPVFKDMGLDGQRAVTVLSSLATTVDKVREAQEVSNKAFKDNVSLQNEFNIRNETAGAKLDKMKKALALTSTEIGEKLYPLMSGSLSVLNKLMQGFGGIITYIKPLTIGVVGLTIAWAAYNAQKIKAWGLDKIQLAEKKIKIALWGGEAVAVNGATLAQRLWNIAVKENPIGLMITLITGALTAIAIYSTKMQENAKQQKELNAIKAEENKQIDDEKRKINSLIQVINSEKASKEDKKRALQQLIDINPNYLKGLTLENLKTAEGKRILDTYIASLREKIRLQSLQDKIKEYSDKVEDDKEKIKNPDPNFLDYLKAFGQNVVSNLDPMVARRKYYNAEHYARQSANVQLAQDEKMQNYYLSQANSMISKNPRLIANGTDTETQTTKSFGGSSSEGKGKGNAEKTNDKAYNNAIKELEKQYSAIDLQAMQNYKDRKITEEEQNAILLMNEINFLSAKKKVQEKYGKDTTDTQKTLLKDQAKIADDEKAMEIKEEEDKKNKLKEQYNAEVQDIEDTKAKAQILINKHKYERLQVEKDTAKIEEETNLAMLSLEVASLEKKLEVQKKYGEKTIETEKQLSEARLNLQKAMSESNTQKESKDTVMERLQKERNAIEQDHKNGLISEEEYQEKLKDIGIRETKEKVKKIKDIINKNLGSVKEMVSNAQSAISGLQDIELTKSEARYNKEEEALQSQLDKGIISQEEYNTKKTALDEKQKEKEKEIKKKYALSEMMMSIADIAVKTAEGVMMAFASAPSYIAPILAGIVTATGAVQTALAVAQYNQIKGAESGLYPQVERAQDGKKFRIKSVAETKTGLYNAPSLLVGENGAEVVIDNKRYKQILRENPQVIDYIVNGAEKGKYPQISAMAMNISKDNMLQNTKALNKLLSAIENSDIYALRKNLKKADKQMNYINEKFS